MSRSSSGLRALVALVVTASLVACGGDGGEPEAQGDLPRTDLIGPALEALVEQRGPDVELVEVAASLTAVDVLVRDADMAVRYRFDGEMTGPLEPRVDERATFRPDEVEVDADRIFDQLMDELPGSAIIDLAVHEDGGVVVTDATVASTNGGVLLVLLQPDGTIIGMQEV